MLRGPQAAKEAVRIATEQRLEIREAGVEFMLIQFIFTSTLWMVPSKRNGRRSK